MSGGSKIVRIASTVDKKIRYNAVAKIRRQNHLGTNYIGPITVYAKHAKIMMESLPKDEKHWFCGGMRSIGVAMELLRKNEVIAVPTDTIYGFAALAQSDEAIEKLYAIKGRERTKPLAITVSTISDIQKWALTETVPKQLFSDLLPGPVTVVLKRKDTLNPRLNPGHDSVGVRVPATKFIRCLSRALDEPLALTSANISNQPSTLHPDEFTDLWPKLGGIFYAVKREKMMMESMRVGSTIVDLTVPGQYEIIRRGIRFERDIGILKSTFDKHPKPQARELQRAESNA